MILGLITRRGPSPSETPHNPVAVPFGGYSINSLARNIAQSHAFLQLLAVTSAQTNTQPGIEENLVFPVFAKLQTADMLEIHDAGAMHAAEQPRIEICHATPYQMTLGTDVQTCVVIGSFNPIDLGGSHERDCPGTPDDHAFEF